MYNLVPAHAGFHALLDLPKLAKTRSGVPFDPHAERWSYRDDSVNVSLNFTKFPLVTDSFLRASKLTLLWYAENMSSSHLMNMYQRLEHLLRTMTVDRNEPMNEITSQDLINYRANLKKRDGWYLGSLSGLLQKWHQLGYPGVADGAVKLLKQFRIEGNIKGEAVLTMGSRTRPFHGHRSPIYSGWA